MTPPTPSAVVAHFDRRIRIAVARTAGRYEPDDARQDCALRVLEFQASRAEPPCDMAAYRSCVNGALTDAMRRHARHWAGWEMRDAVAAYLRSRPAPPDPLREAEHRDEVAALRLSERAARLASCTPTEYAAATGRRTRQAGAQAQRILREAIRCKCRVA